ncbi:MAG: hypothetical protein OHK0029_13790 [Armatimonadaceae bacterium]
MTPNNQHAFTGDLLSQASHLWLETLDVISFAVNPREEILYMAGHGCRYFPEAENPENAAGKTITTVFGENRELEHRLQLAREGYSGPWRLHLAGNIWSLTIRRSETAAPHEPMFLGLLENVSRQHRLEENQRWYEREIELLTVLTSEVGANLSAYELSPNLLHQLRLHLDVSGIIFYAPAVPANSTQAWGVPDEAFGRLVPYVIRWFDAATVRCQQESRNGAVVPLSSQHFLTSSGEIRRFLAADGCFRRVQPVPLTTADEVLGALVLLSTEDAAFSQQHPIFFDVLGRQMAVALKHTAMYREMEANHVELRSLMRRLVNAQERERLALAKEMHDELGQRLTCLKISLDLAGKYAENAGESENAEKYRRQAQEATSDLIQRVRNMSMLLRPSLLDDMGLFHALSWYCEQFTQQTQIQVHWSHDGIAGRRFSKEVETAAFRIVQESLTNVARHADTDQVWVHLQFSEKENVSFAGTGVSPSAAENPWADGYPTDSAGIWISIEDDGAGFDPAARHTSTGVSSMRERALSLGGLWCIVSSPGEGTRIEAFLPAEVRTA